jgi:hypothetical protein
VLNAAGLDPGKRKMVTHTPIAYTIPDFCRSFGIGRTTAYRLIETGQIIARKIGRRTVIDAASAARWYASLPVGVAA